MKYLPAPMLVFIFMWLTLIGVMGIAVYQSSAPACATVTYICPDANLVAITMDKKGATVSYTCNPATTAPKPTPNKTM